MSQSADLDPFPQLYARSQRFTIGKPRTFQIVDEGQTVLFCRSRSETDPTLALWKFDVATRTEQLLVDPDTIGANKTLSQADKQQRERSRESGRGIISYQPSSTGSVCFVLGQKLHVVDITSGDLKTVETQTPVFDPRFSPDGTHIAYVHHQGVRVVELGVTGSDRTVTSNTSPNISYGRADFIAAEEIGRTRGFWWSPDGGQLAIAKVDDAKVQQWWVSQPSQPHSPPTPIKYPAAGGANTTTSLTFASIDGQKTTWTPLDHEYLVRVEWTDRDGPLVVTQSRDQRTMAVNVANPASGSLNKIYSIKDDRWVDVIPGTPRRSQVGLITVENRICADSKRKYRALCVDGVEKTGPDIDVRSVVSVETDSNQNAIASLNIWVPPIGHTIVRVNLISQEIEPVVEQSGASSGATANSVAVITSTSWQRPGSESKVYELGRQNPTPIHTIKSHSSIPAFSPQPKWLSLSDGQIEVAVFLPEDHNGTSQLPVLMDPYGGPHARRVLDNHDGHLVSQWFANQGYAVVVADGRGTPGRGPEIEQAVWGDLATPTLEDQIQALDAAANNFTFFDLDRVAVRGWSFGGYLAALAVLRRPDRFHCALAGAPVTSWHLYDTHYTERYLGHPQTYPEQYRQTDLIELVENLDPTHPQRDLLLLHGLADDNVVAAHTLQLSTALLGAGYPHQVLPLSGVTHMTPHAVVAENLLRLQLSFLNSSMK